MKTPSQGKDFLSKGPDLLLGLITLPSKSLRLLGAPKGRVPLCPQYAGRLELGKHLSKETRLLLEAVAQALKGK